MVITPGFELGNVGFDSHHPIEKSHGYVRGEKVIGRCETKWVFFNYEVSDL